MENWLINIIIGLVCAIVGAIVGGGVGHHLTMKLYRERSKQQKEAFWREFTLLKERYSSCLSALIDDYKNPLKDSYSAPVEFDMSLIDSLSTEICASTELLTFDQRELIINLKSYLPRSRTVIGKRDEFIVKWYKNKDKAECLNPIRFHTAKMLHDVIDVIFYTYKIAEEKQNFSLGERSFQDRAKVACSISKIPYDQPLWIQIEKQLGG